MADRLILLPRHRRMVEKTLREHIPEAEVWAYGSRVNGRAHEASDLDLVVRGPALKPLEAKLVQLVEAFRESSLPIIVQICDWSRIPKSFRGEIAQDYVVLQSGQAPPAHDAKGIAESG